MGKLSLLVFAGSCVISKAQTYSMSEVLMPDAGTCGLSAVIKTPKAEIWEQAALRVLAGCMRTGSKTYTTRQIDLLPQILTLPVCEVGHGFVLARLSVAKGQVAQGADILSALLTQPIIDAETVEVAVRSELEGPQNPGSAAWNPVQFTNSNIDVTRVEFVWRKYFRPENTFLSAAGPFAKYEGEAAFRSALREWPDKPEKRIFGKAKLEILSNSPTLVGCWTLGSVPETRPQAVANAALASIALGIGKDTTLFRVIREGTRASYRQETMLMPAQNGWASHLGVFRTGEMKVDEIAKDRSLILADIATWTPATLSRAQAILKEGLGGTYPENPFWINERTPLGVGPAAESAFSALNMALSGQLLKLETLTKLSKQATVEDIQKAAKNLVENGTLNLLPGN